MSAATMPPSLKHRRAATTIDDMNHERPTCPSSDDLSGSAPTLQSAPVSAKKLQLQQGKLVTADSASEILSTVKAIGNAGNSRGSTAGLWWTAAAWIAYNHLVALLALYFYPPSHQYLVYYTLVQGFLQVMGITAGYHRLWSHRSYTASVPLRIFLAITGLQAFQGSARWWALRHRVHHRFTDTEYDPYNARRGFWYAHIGWLFTPPPKMNAIRMINARDLDNDMVCAYQKKYLLHGYVLFGGFLPALIGYLLCNDALGGFLYIGMWARVISWHSIFCINSLAHMIGDKPYNRFNTASTNLLCAVITNGEGYHNYHHEFPDDYRAGWRWYDYEPTKWFIAASAALSLASKLHRMPANEVQKKRIQVLQEQLDEMRQSVKYPPTDDELPRMTMSELKIKAGSSGRILLALDGYVMDVTDFKGQHPGGEAYLLAFNGKDATAAFHGVVNTHTQGSTNYAHMFRVAKLTQE